MKLFKYNQFVDTNPINENLDKAKKLMKDIFMIKNVANELGFIEGELKAQLDNKEILSVSLKDFTPEQQEQIKGKLRQMKLTDEQVKSIEKEPAFLKIREYLGQKYLGWMYPFTYFHFIENASLEDLFTKVSNDEEKKPISVFSKLVEYSGLLDKLPKKFDHNFIDPNIPNNLEKLVDGIDSLDDYRKIKKVIDQLTPTQKKDYMESPVVIKDQFAEVSRALCDLGGKDKEKHDRLWKGFFGELKTIEDDVVLFGKSYKKGDKRYFGQLYRYKNIREFIKAAQNYLKSADNENILKFYESINKCNERFGAAGADIVFDENGILIIEVKSFQANVMLNSHTRHCIKDYQTQWDNYVANHYNKQYYIYNFNIPQYENLSTIGITIEPGQKIRACHQKDDGNIQGRIRQILKSFEKDHDISEDIFITYLKPMSNEEITKRERTKLAEREIVKKGISIEQIEKYVKEDGADINRNHCAALLNAVEENNIEKVKKIIELGGNPNLKSGSDSIINKAQNLDMIKILVSAGSELTPEVFRGICKDADAVEYCLKAGLDPNFDNSLPYRQVIKGSYKDRDNMGESYMDSFKVLIKYGGKVYNKEGKNMILRYAAEYGRFDILEYVESVGLSKEFKPEEYVGAELWLSHSRKSTDDIKKKISQYLREKSGLSQEEFNKIVLSRTTRRP